MNAKEFLLRNWDVKDGIISFDMVVLFMEEYHTEKSKPKVKSLEERKDTFENNVMEYHEFGEAYMFTEFIEYWTEHGEKDKKMRFEKEKSFGIKRRLATWKKNSKKWESKSVSLSDKMKNQYGL